MQGFGRLVVVLVSIFGMPGSAEEAPRQIPYVPWTNEPACDPQPTDTEKIQKAVEFYVSGVSANPRQPFAGGVVDMSFLKDAETALAAHPDCCKIAYEDSELYVSREIIERMGPNFGGFVYLKFPRQLLTGGEAGNVYFSRRLYVVDACGNPVTEL